MKYLKLGNSDLEVSRICLGCMGFGDSKRGMHSWTLPEAQSREIIKYALDQGINFFDTAMAYQSGTSEEFLGRVIKDYAKREEVVIATKFTPRTQVEIEAGVNGIDHVLNCLEASLERLQMDYVDLYIYHMWDYNTPLEEIMEGLNQAVVSGKVRYIGISNCYAWQLAKANALALAKGWAQFVSIQGHYNLIFREEEREMAPYCHEENIAMTPYSPLASGRLAKMPDEQSKRLIEDTYAMGKYDASHQDDLKIIERVAQLANQLEVSMAEVSLAWLLEKVTAPVVGATKLAHIETAVKAVDLKLDQEQLDYLEKLYRPHALVGVLAQNK